MPAESTMKTRHKERLTLILAVCTAVLVLLFGGNQSPHILFLINSLAVVSIVMSASSVVRHADVLTHRFGEPYGSLILSLSIVFLEISMISILMLSGTVSETLLRDTVYSIVIIVMAGLVGIALILGGHKYGSQRFNLSGNKHYLISIIPLTFMILIFPSAIEDGYSGGQLILISLICLMLYAVFLRIQTRTHRNFFVYEHEDGHGAHGKPSPYSNRRHFAFLGIHLLAVIGVTELLAHPLSSFMAVVKAPTALTGLLVALLTLSPETTGAVRSILRNQTQRAMNLFLGSVLATISLTVPAVILIAFLTGQHLVLGLDLPNAMLLIATLMVCQISLTGGETNTHSGFAHMALFILYLMLLFK